MLCPFQGLTITCASQAIYNWRFNWSMHNLRGIAVSWCYLFCDWYTMRVSLLTGNVAGARTWLIQRRQTYDKLRHWRPSIVVAAHLVVRTEPLMTEVRVKSLDKPGCRELVRNERLNYVLQTFSHCINGWYNVKPKCSNGERPEIKW